MNMVNDMINKIITLNEYCRMFGMGKKVPHELYAVVLECDEYLKEKTNDTCNTNKSRY